MEKVRGQEGELQKIEDLENKKSFSAQIKNIFYIFKGLSVGEIQKIASITLKWGNIADEQIL